MHVPNKTVNYRLAPTKVKYDHSEYDGSLHWSTVSHIIPWLSKNGHVRTTTTIHHAPSTYRSYGLLKRLQNSHILFQPLQLVGCTPQDVLLTPTHCIRSWSKSRS